jgi:riboflavin biosynthesis pyrimidine reductase
MSPAAPDGLQEMTKVLAGITTSVDGYVTGPGDGPGKGLGEGGEALHAWVFGGPWTYDEGPRGEPTGEDAASLSAMMERVGAAAGGKDVSLMGGADVIRQALAAGLVDELTLIIAPIVLGGGKRLFEGFDRRIVLEHLGARQSPHATFIEYRIGAGRR